MIGTFIIVYYIIWVPAVEGGSTVIHTPLLLQFLLIVYAYLSVNIHFIFAIPFGMEFVPQIRHNAMHVVIRFMNLSALRYQFPPSNYCNQ